jgi:hypothetical protein
VRLGEFGGSASTYDDSLAAPDPIRRETFVRTNQSTADGKPLTYACTEMTGGIYWCKTSYPWQNGTYINYVFRSGVRDIEEKGLRIDARLHEVLGSLRRSER